MARVICRGCQGIGTRYDHLPGFCRGCDGTGVSDQSWVEKAFDIGPRIITDGHGGLGPCRSRGCYLIGCDNEARMGLTVHWDDLNPDHGKHLHLLRDIPYLLDDLGSVARLHASSERARIPYPEATEREHEHAILNPGELYARMGMG